MSRKPLEFLVLAVAAAVLLGGCDFVRRAAGRPTSEDIARKKELIEAVRAKRQASADSAIMAQKSVSDSLALLDSIKSSGIKINEVSQIHSAPDTAFKNKFCIVIGAFGTPSNAERLRRRAESAGYTALILHFGKGMSTVAIAPTDRLKTLVDAFEQARTEPFFPQGAWILVNN